MSKSRVSLNLTRLLIFTICVTLIFGINVNWTSFNSSPNKHFVRWGIERVEADYNGVPTYIKNINGVDYEIQECKSSGTFVVPQGVTKIDYTVVGGGGGAAGVNGSKNSSGGGGGGYVTSVYNYSVTPGQNIPVVIGAGGAGGHWDGYKPGKTGGYSQFGSTYAMGGKGSVYNGPGGDGGSGGGGNAYGCGGIDGADGESSTEGGGTGQHSTTRGVDGILYGRGGDAGKVSGKQGGLPNTGGGAYGTKPSGSASSGAAGGSGIVIVRWVANIAPTVTVTQPSPNTAFSEVDGYNSISLEGTVNDLNTGDIISIKYNIDGGTTQTVEETVTTSGSLPNIDIGVGDLAEGDHTLNVWAVDDKGATSEVQEIPLIIDTSGPILDLVDFEPTTSSIIISGSADGSIAGLDDNPYRYTISTNDPTDWLSDTDTSFEFGDLSLNTQYTAVFEARDLVGHISSESQDIYTLAEVPFAEVDNVSSYSMDVAVIDNNPDYTEYQIEVNDGEYYITPEGTLTSSPIWVYMPSRSITVQGLEPETNYYFRVMARNGDEIETEWSSPVSGETRPSPPGSPANIIATATDTSITLSWDALEDAISYEVEADGEIVYSDTDTTFTHTDLNPGVPYVYRIRGVNEGGSGNWSLEITKLTLPSAPDIPSNLTALPLSTSVTVTWDNVPGATGYDLEVDGALVTNGPNTNYRHTSLTPGTSHSYRVRSVNPGGKSEWSETITVDTLLDTSPVPVNIETIPGKYQIKVVWDEVENATGYEVEADGVRIDNGARTSYTHNNLQPDTEHTYRVRSRKGATFSDWSAMIIETTLTDAFGIPENFTATADGTSVLLAWDPVTDAIGYDVKIDGEVIDNGMDTFCVHDGLEPGSYHTYRVRARGENETSSWSELQEVTTFMLPTPLIITVTATEDTLTTVWEEVYGATKYSLEMDGATISDIYETQYTCEGLMPGTQYQIRVRAENDNGISNWSTPIVQSTIVPGFSEPLLSGIVRRNSITLVWNSVSETASYDLEIDGIVTEDITDTSYIHSDLSAGTSHTYRIRKKYGTSTGEWSSSLTVSTLSELPSVPTNITASSSMTAIQVSWDEVQGASSYEVEVDGVVIENGTGTSYLHQNLHPADSHTYRVRARNAGGCSEWSDLLTKSVLSSVQTFEIDALTGDEFNLMLSASGIQDIGSYSFTVSYSVEDFDVLDLCAITARIDKATGSITGTDIKITQYEPGNIVFTRGNTAQPFEVWSGIINSIRFRAKHDGQSTITYSIN